MSRSSCSRVCWPSRASPPQQPFSQTSMRCCSNQLSSSTTSDWEKLDDAVFGQLLDVLATEPGGVVGLSHQVVVGHTREEMVAARGEVLALLELLALQRDV